MNFWSSSPRNALNTKARVRNLTRRPAPEGLEDRRLMTVFNVNSLADVLNPGPGVVTLRSAIQAANTTPGSNTINLTVPGSYKITTIGTATDNTAGELAYTGTGKLTIENTSGGNVIVDGGGLNRVFDISPAGATTPFTVTFQDLTITDGSATSAANADGPDASGGGIRAQGGASVVLNNVVLTHNFATADGGGISLESPKNDSTGTLTINNSTISNNHAGDAGGGIETDGTGLVTINSGTQIVGNTCVNQGAGIWLDAGGASLNLSGAVIANNTAITMLAGGIGNAGAGNVIIDSSIVENNFSGGTGGGFGDAVNMGNLTVSNSAFLNNTAAASGGGIQEGGPKTTISDSVFVNNVSQGNGGGLFVAGTLATVSDSTFNGNTAVNGAGIEANAATFSLSDSTVASNHTLATNAGTGGSGGGLDVSTGADAVTVSNDLFLNNTANNAGMATGSGINLAVGALDLFNSQFTGNAANTGGALNFAGTTLMASGNTFNNNRSTIGGGALNFEGTGTLGANNGSELTNNTFVANATAGNGGAILDAGPGDLALLNETINGNSAQNNGGGVALTGTGTLSFQNTIVALNTAGGMGNDVFTGIGFTVTGNGGNLIGTTIGSSGFGPGTLTGNPMLNPLENNGGQRAGASDGRQVVQTESLLPGSPAFDKGTAVSPLIDERGFPRPGTGNTTASIGAYEPQYASNATPAQMFVENVFEVLLNRRADNGAGFFVDLLNHGATPNAVVQLIEASQEYRTHEVQSVFDRYLHRAADPGALQSFVNFLGGGTVEQLESVVAGSQEYYDIHGDSTDTFLEGLYLDGLGRLSDEAGEAGLRYALDTGSSRTQVASMVFSSQEYLNDLVESDYQSILGRDTDSPGLNFFVKALQMGTTDEMVLADLLGSGEGIFRRTGA